MPLLASLCNLQQVASSGLLLVGYAGKTPRIVDIGAGRLRCFGCTGLVVSDSLLYCAWLGPEFNSFLSVLDAFTLAVLESRPLEDIKDVHSLCVSEGWLYLASTGTDEIRRIETARVGGKSELVWRATSSGSDTHHVNAILTLERRILCSAFGPMKGERKSTALDGYVVDIASNEVLWRGIEHPHSLAVGPDDIYVAESRRARVRGLRTGRVYPVDGYARGVAFTRDGRLVAGSSRGRARSRSLGTIENPFDPGELEGQTGLTFFDLGDDKESPPSTAYIDLSDHGPEIYDIAEL